MGIFEYLCARLKRSLVPSSITQNGLEVFRQYEENLMETNKADRRNDLEPIWGAKAIAQEIGVPARRGLYLLASGYLKGARKMGGVWTITRRQLRECFEGEHERDAS